MSRTWKPTLLYAFAHFAVDLGCAYAMFSAFSGSAMGFLLYNFCAFAMQMPIGILADAINRNLVFALLGTALVGLICLFPQFGLLGCVILGLGNGLFHIGGGLDVLNLSGRSAAPLGIFVSPGAYGIFLGSVWASQGGSRVVILLALLAAGLAMLPIRACSMPSNDPVEFPDRQILLPAVLLFAVVVLRSYGGLSGVFAWKTGFWSYAAVTAVVLGKAAGGILADRFSPFLTAVGSLLLAAILFLFGTQPFPGTLAMFFFNMTMPITLFALARKMPGCKGFSFGLLTFALFLGFLPTYLSIGATSTVGMSVITVISAVLLLPAVGKRKAAKP